ncbi:SRPBCC family protein [Georgenia yuyongxinii]|uniref:Carbon monoxide dehydrogenase n=1 Tax=Georgenia yuyongxinii TaxID=2589797 RepID=A0A552WLR9_9MICO|nr:SRPBCC family protein [Georgenia yuyongxinii]TRW43715.1 carbon monoxide dehydrogenase [Georgenia yuyongxinii]
MELTHTFTVPADPARTWALLTDLHRVGSCFPGASVTEADADSFAGTVKVKLGPIALTYTGTGSFVERDDAGHRAVIEARGKDRRGNGTASATVTMSLTDDGSGTRVEVLTDLSITGKPAQFGRGVMQDVSGRLLGQFVACIESQFEAASGPTAEPGMGESGPTAEPAPAEPVRPARPPLVGTTASAAPAPAVATASPPAPAIATTSAPARDAARGMRPAPAMPAGQTTDAVDLGAAVLPVLVQRYATIVAVGLVGLVAGIVVGRAGRRS